MEILDNKIDEKTKRNIIDIYTEIFGEQYRSIIEKKVNNIIFLPYYKKISIEKYIMYLENCKTKELVMKFLEQIGEKLDEPSEKSCIYKYQKNIAKIQELAEIYIGDIYEITHNRCENVGIKAWKVAKEENTEENVENRIDFLNFFRGYEKDPITFETYQSFCQTEEYSEIYKKIQLYLKIYDKICDEYENYLKQIESLKEYVKEEEQRSKKIFEDKFKKIYFQVEKDLPDGIIKYFETKHMQPEQRGKKLVSGSLIENALIEYFSSTSEKKLGEQDKFSQDIIYKFRRFFFQNFELEFPKQRYDFKSEKEYYEYYIKIVKEKGMNISKELADKMKKLKKEEYKKAIEEIELNNPKLLENVKIFGWTEEEQESQLREAYEKYLKNQSVCILPKEEKQRKVPIVLFTPRETEFGKMDYVFLHEVCHAIEFNDMKDGNTKSGFDLLINDTVNNQYVDRRKYEILNEAITDIFAIEARKKSYKKGQYILEPELISDYDVENHNTPNIIKQILKPIVKKYKEQIIKARITGDNTELFETIGKENFEELNDLINKIFSLEEEIRLDKKENKIEYSNVLSMVNQIYMKIDMYANRKQYFLESMYKNIRMDLVNQAGCNLKKDIEKSEEHEENNKPNT